VLRREALNQAVFSSNATDSEFYKQHLCYRKKYLLGFEGEIVCCR
jgi:hypothetical protein